MLPVIVRNFARWSQEEEERSNTELDSAHLQLKRKSSA